jgi:hypothetical protein
MATSKKKKKGIFSYIAAPHTHPDTILYFIHHMKARRGERCLFGLPLIARSRLDDYIFVLIYMAVECLTCMPLYLVIAQKFFSRKGNEGDSFYKMKLL